MSRAEWQEYRVREHCRLQGERTSGQDVRTANVTGSCCSSKHCQELAWACGPRQGIYLIPYNCACNINDNLLPLYGAYLIDHSHMMIVM